MLLNETFLVLLASCLYFWRELQAQFLHVNKHSKLTW